MILLTGENGQVGSELKQILKNKNKTFIAPNILSFDLTNQDNIYKFIKEHNISYIINTAAFTDVNAAEENDTLCNKVNVSGTKYLCNICNELNIPLIHISSEYVFDGTKKGEYEIFDKTNPLNKYGKSKELGEQIIQNSLQNYKIIRTSWVFGNGINFIKKILQNQNKTLNVVNDQIGSPTFAKDLANAIYDLLFIDYNGILHITNQDYCSFYDLANHSIKISNQNKIILPCSTTDFNSKVQRPLNSRLSNKKMIDLGLKKLPHFLDSVHYYINNYKI